MPIIERQLSQNSFQETVDTISFDQYEIKLLKEYNQTLRLDVELLKNQRRKIEEQKEDLQRQNIMLRIDNEYLTKQNRRQLKQTQAQLKWKTEELLILKKDNWQLQKKLQNKNDEISLCQGQLQKQRANVMRQQFERRKNNQLQKQILKIANNSLMQLKLFKNKFRSKIQKSQLLLEAYQIITQQIIAFNNLKKEFNKIKQTNNEMIKVQIRPIRSRSLTEFRSKSRISSQKILQFNKSKNIFPQKRNSLKLMNKRKID